MYTGLGQLFSGNRSVRIDVIKWQLNPDAMALPIDGSGAERNVLVRSLCLSDGIDGPIVQPKRDSCRRRTDRWDEIRLEPAAEHMIVGRITNRENQGVVPEGMKFFIGVSAEEKIVAAPVVRLLLQRRGSVIRTGCLRFERS